MNTDKRLYLLFILSFKQCEVLYTFCPKKMFDKWYEALILLTLILDDQIVCQSLFEQWNGNGVVSIEVLLYKQGGQWLVDTLELGVEGAVVKLYLFDNAGSLDVVVVALKFQIEEFDARHLVSR